MVILSGCIDCIDEIMILGGDLRECVQMSWSNFMARLVLYRFLFVV